MAYRKYKSLKEHIKYAARALRRRSYVYKKQGVELTPEAHTLLWQNRRYMISIICKMMAVHFNTEDDSPLMAKWRKGRVVNNMVTRLSLITLCAQKSATLTQLAYICEGAASREKVRLVMAEGIELGLLERVGKDSYMISDSLSEELFNRSIMRLRHPDVIEFSKFCLTVANVEDLILNPAFDREEDHPLSTPITLPNALKEGIYPEAEDDLVEDDEK